MENAGTQPFVQLLCPKHIIGALISQREPGVYHIVIRRIGMIGPILAGLGHQPAAAQGDTVLNALGHYRALRSPAAVGGESAAPPQPADLIPNV